MLKIHVDSRLPCPQRVLLAAKELGIDASFKEVKIQDQYHESAEYLKLNPFGGLPCLEDHSQDPPLILYESRAIARYLAIQHGSGRLVPQLQDARAIALFEQGASVEVTAFDPVANRLVFEELFKEYLDPSQTKDIEMIKSLQARLHFVLNKLDEILEAQAFMAGQNFSLVDIFYMPYMYHLVTRVWPTCLQHRRNLAQWWRQIESRPCFEVLTVPIDFGTSR